MTNEEYLKKYFIMINKSMFDMSECQSCSFDMSKIDSTHLRDIQWLDLFDTTFYSNNDETKPDRTHIDLGRIDNSSKEKKRR